MKLEAVLEATKETLKAYESGDPSPAIDGAGGTLAELIAALEVIGEFPDAKAAFEERLAKLNSR